MIKSIFGSSGAFQNSTNEQNLMESILIEQIQTMGMDVYYVRRSFVNLNPILGEDASAIYNRAFQLEAYFDNPEGFGDSTNLMSKFGLQSLKQMSFTISRKRFNEEFWNLLGVQEPTLQQNEMTPKPHYHGPAYYHDSGTVDNVQSHLYTVPEEVRPKEKDLIYLPLTKEIFRISGVQVEVPDSFYQLGKVYTYRLDVEKFKWNHESFVTMVPEIDSIPGRVQQLNNNATPPPSQGDNTILQNELASIIDDTHGSSPFDPVNW